MLKVIQFTKSNKFTKTEEREREGDDNKNPWQHRVTQLVLH
jgi:hypothetical protein